MPPLLPILLGVLALLVCSAFFSGAETALMSLSKAQVRRLQNGGARDRMIHRLLRDSQRTLGTILLGNLFVNILLTALTAEALARNFASPLWGAVLSIVIVTPILILAGELLPKVNGLRHNLALARFCAPWLIVLRWLLAPLLWILDGLSRAVQKALGCPADGAKWESLTNAEVLASFDSAEVTGSATSREHDLLERILRFGTIEAKEIMVPRLQLIGVDDTMTVRQAAEFAQKNDYSSLPVFHGNIDEIWGTIAFADALRFRSSTLADTPLADFRKKVETAAAESAREDLPVSPVEFIPGTARVEGVLETFRRHALRVAIVVSEYGGTLGMVTRSMILEEVVGRFAFSGRDCNRLQPHAGGLLADGRARLRFVEDELGCDFDDAEAETLAGFVMEQLGRVPVAGDAFVAGDHRFQVVRTSGKVASAVLIAKAEREALAPNPDATKGEGTAC